MFCPSCFVVSLPDFIQVQHTIDCTVCFVNMWKKITQQFLSLPIVKLHLQCLLLIPALFIFTLVMAGQGKALHSKPSCINGPFNPLCHDSPDGSWDQHQGPSSMCFPQIPLCRLLHPCLQRSVVRCDFMFWALVFILNTNEW